MTEHISILQGYIDHLEYMKKNADDFFDREQADKDIEAFKAAIQALEQEPCPDAISRQAVLKTLNDMDNVLDEDRTIENYKELLKECYEVLPPVTPQLKMGRWIHRENMDYLDKNKVVHNHFMCQDCGFIHDFIDGHTAQYNYCPNCGAKMEVEE